MTKQESLKPSTASKPGLPDFSALAAVSQSPGGAIPNFSINTGGSKKPSPVESPTPLVAKSVEVKPAVAKLAATKQPAKIVSEKIVEKPAKATTPEPTATSNKPIAGEQRTQATAVFGLTWIPYLTDGTSLVLYIAAIHQLYELFTGIATAAASLPTIVLLVAAGTALLGLTLVIRLLSRIATSLSQSKSG